LLYIDELTDYGNVLAHIDGYAKGLGLPPIDVDGDKVSTVIRGMRFDFPAQGGEVGASPFKKAANFFCYFVAERPILNPFPKDVVGVNIAAMLNHQNVMVAYDMAIECLHNATIHRADKEFVLKERILLSKHSYTDLIQACGSIMPQTHFHIMSVLFEQLAYKFNPDASYDLVV